MTAPTAALLYAPDAVIGGGIAGFVCLCRLYDLAAKRKQSLTVVASAKVNVMSRGAGISGVHGVG